MKLDHIVVLVRSLDASLPWYAAMLEAIGFTKRRDHVWGSDDGLFIDLKEASEGSRDYERYGPGLNHLGFTAPSLDDFERVRATMAESGFDVPDAQDFGNSIATFFRDPDGMRIEVAHYR